MEEELKKFLEKQTCRGCYNHCQLSNPNCGRSKIFIQEATEKFNNMKSQDKFGTRNILN